MSEETSFGLELVLSAHSPHLTNKADALTCLVHWKLLTEGNLRCVGTGEIFSVSSASNEHPPSEILRKEAFFGDDGADAGVAIKYRGSGEAKTSKYLLKLHELDPETLLLNVIRIADEKVLTLKFNPNKVISDSFRNTSDIGNVFVDPKDLIRRVEKEIIEELFPKEPPGEPCSSLKVDRGTTSTTTYEPRPIYPGGHIPPPTLPMRPFPDIVDPMGRGDLEPFSNDGSGMLMDPFGVSRRRDPSFPNFDPPLPGMRGSGRRGFP